MRLLDASSLGALLLGLTAIGASAAGRGGHAAVPFAAAAGGLWFVVVATLASLRIREQDPRPLGVATKLTLVRGWLISAVAGFIPVPPLTGLEAWMPGALYTSAALCDLVDGYVARQRNEVSAVGARLDIAMDGLGLLVASAAAIAVGRLPIWYLMVGVAYYLFHGGLWLRARWGLPAFPERLPSSRYTRQFAGCQMGLVATALFPVLGPPGTSITAALFMTPNLALFTRDWLVVTGRLDPDAAQFPRGIERAAHDMGLPLRLGAACGLVAMITSGALAGIVVGLAILIALGVFTRLTAFGAGIVVAHLLARQPTLTGFATFTALMLLMLVGSGRAALWSPEDRWMLRRAGERGDG